MLGHNLFPRDFIYCLDAPTNYFGPQKVFIDEESSQAILRTISKDFRSCNSCGHLMKYFPAHPGWNESAVFWVRTFTSLGTPTRRVLESKNKEEIL